MMSGRSKRAENDLDAFLEGRTGRVPEDLAPLAAAAEELRAEVHGLEIDPRAAPRHIADAMRALQEAQHQQWRQHQRQQQPQPQQQQVRQLRDARRPRWRRQMATGFAAAALLVVPATIASANSLPGQMLYPVKLGIEQVRLVAAVSPEAEAEERTQIAQTRLDEVRGLLDGGDWEQVASARQELADAHDEAVAAVGVARDEGADTTTVAAFESELAAVPDQEQAAIAGTLERLPADQAEQVRTMITPPADGGQQSEVPGDGLWGKEDENRYPQGVDPEAPGGSTPTVPATPTPEPTSSLPPSTSTTTTTTTASTTTTTTITPQPGTSATLRTTPSAGEDTGTPAP